MKSIFLQANTVIWAVLALATALSWYMGGDASLNIPAVMLLIAFFKTRLVIMHFMEVNHAPLPLRIIGEAWGIVCCAALIVLYS
ncbi:cytochrome C oxidase subunit IV family protein [Zhongshania guokunii]|uniref:Cytochrome C oxidase subunit IV family protein n=1 Tax=Zhongshania guokunii TaxID=641783 RepID=A0ABV3UD87_9GAMM